MTPARSIHPNLARPTLRLLLIFAVLVLVLVLGGHAHAQGFSGLSDIGTKANEFATAVKGLAKPIGLALVIIGSVMLLMGDKSRLVKALGAVAMTGGALAFASTFVGAAIGG